MEQFGAQREGRKETEERKKRDQKARREREREDINIPTAAGTLRFFFFLAVWIWQRIFCIVREPIYPLSNMVLRANHTEVIHMHTHFKDTNTLTEDLRTHGHKRTTCAYTQAPPYTHIYISNRYFETNPNMLLAWNLINSRWVCVRQWMYVITCASALTNNHLGKPDQGRSHCFRAGALVGGWHAIRRTPQTNRLHNFSVTIAGAWAPIPNEISSTCVDARTQKLLTARSPWWRESDGNDKQGKRFYEKKTLRVCFQFHLREIYCLRQLFVDFAAMRGSGLYLWHFKSILNVHRHNLSGVSDPQLKLLPPANMFVTIEQNTRLYMPGTHQHSSDCVASTAAANNAGPR